MTDRPTLDAVAVVSRAGGWPVQAEGDAISAPYSPQSTGPPPGTCTASMLVRPLASRCEYRTEQAAGF